MATDAWPNWSLLHDINLVANTIKFYKFINRLSHRQSLITAKYRPVCETEMTLIPAIIRVVYSIDSDNGQNGRPSLEFVPHTGGRYERYHCISLTRPEKVSYNRKKITYNLMEIITIKCFLKFSFHKFT